MHSSKPIHAYLHYWNPTDALNIHTRIGFWVIVKLLVDNYLRIVDIKVFYVLCEFTNAAAELVSARSLANFLIVFIVINL